MSDYKPPITDIGFLLDRVVGLPDLFQLPGREDVDPEVVPDLLNEAGRFMADKIAPTNAIGDRTGTRQEGDTVVSPESFGPAYAAFVEAGWGAVPHPEEHGGGDYPLALGVVIQELFAEANMAFQLISMLSQGAIELLLQHGDEIQRQLYLDNLISGEWTGTMCLTEPEAGSDVGALRTRAEPVGDGSYRLTGTKIFITWGEHELAENIVHLVLARIPGAPAGTRGITCFIVPKFLVNPDGSLGERNDLRVSGLEEKMGIHASPTCVMNFGDGEGALGWPIGGENKGMSCMFTMMNYARLTVGVEGLAQAERAYRLAADYARERLQGVAIGGPERSGPAPIIDHADVRRMLLTMRTTVAALRFIAYETTVGIDRSHYSPDADDKAKWADRVALLVPLIKAWGTDMGVEMSSLGVQVLGGVGYCEEAGAAQFYRDSKIAAIYEGTNGIQAADLAFRKLGLSGGRAVHDLLDDIASTVSALREAGGDLKGVGDELDAALEVGRKATEQVQNFAKTDPRSAAAASSPYLRLLSTLVGGWGLGRSALAARDAIAALDEGLGDDGYGFDRDFLEDKQSEAVFYATHVLPNVHGLATTVAGGSWAFDTIPADRL